MPDKRLIDANALDVIRFTPTGGELLDATERGWNECITFLQTKAKTIDAVEVVHGMWVMMVGFPACSKCGCSPADWEAKPDNPEGYPPYCHSCGAKMDAKEG